MGEALGISHENERQLVVGAYMLGFGLAQLVFGPLADRFGRRVPLLFGLSIYVVCAFAATFAPNFAVLLALRLTQGLGAAACPRGRDRRRPRPLRPGRDMAEVMSLIFMVFMAMPIIAPGVDGTAAHRPVAVDLRVHGRPCDADPSLWAFFRLPETLHPEYRRELTFKSVTGGFGIVFTNRLALFYGLAGMFLFGAMFGFVSSSQQIFVDIFGLGALFPVAFAAMAGMMAVSSFLNSRIVKRFGMRRLSHFALIVYISGSILLVAFSLAGFIPALAVLQPVDDRAVRLRLGGVQHELAVHGAARRRGRHRRFRLRLHPDRGRRCSAR